jgi:hypothetical protein
MSITFRTTTDTEEGGGRRSARRSGRRGGRSLGLRIDLCLADLDEWAPGLARRPGELPPGTSGSHPTGPSASPPERTRHPPPLTEADPGRGTVVSVQGPPGTHALTDSPPRRPGRPHAPTTDSDTPGSGRPPGRR